MASFAIKPPAFGVLTPTGIFTGAQPNGDFGTGMKDIGLPGVCGTGHADETIYAIEDGDSAADAIAVVSTRRDSISTPRGVCLRDK